MTVVESPSVTVEVTRLAPVRPATASSISFVTWLSISAGAAPDWATETATRGTSMFGKRVIGRLLKACQPRTRNRKKASSGATGLRIDQAEKFMRAPSVHGGGDRGDPVARADEGPGLGHDGIARRKAFGDLHQSAVTDAGLDRDAFHQAILDPHDDAAFG